MNTRIRFTALLAVLGVLAFAVISTQAQVNTPVGVIEKSTFDSTRQISVEANLPVILAASPLTDLVTYEINEPSAVYLFGIPPDGGAVELLFPNRDEQNNLYFGQDSSDYPQEYSFPDVNSDEGFQYSESTGTYYIQAVATPFAIDLAPPDDTSNERYSTVVESAAEFPAYLVDLIDAHGISQQEWATSWTSFQVVTGLTASVSDRRFVIRIRDPNGDLLPGGILPTVSVGEFAVDTGQPVTFHPQVRHGNAVRIVPFPPGSESITFSASVPFYTPSPNTTCDLFLDGNLTVAGKTPCNFTADEMQGIKFDALIDLYFYFSSPSACGATFVTNPASPVAQQSTTFDATASQRVCGSTSSFTWDFGDGNSSAGVAPNHTYLAPGSYNVTLIVSSGGQTYSSQRSITVLSQPVIPPQCPIPRLCLQQATGDFNLVGAQTANTIRISGRSGFGEVVFDANLDHNVGGSGTYPSGSACLDFVYQVNSFGSAVDVKSRLYRAYSSITVEYKNVDPLRDSTQPISLISDRYLFAEGDVPILGVSQLKQLQLNIPPNTTGVQVLIDTGILYNGTGATLDISLSSFQLSTMTQCP